MSPECPNVPECPTQEALGRAAYAPRTPMDAAAVDGDIHLPIGPRVRRTETSSASLPRTADPNSMSPDVVRPDGYTSFGSSTGSFL